MSNTLDLNRRLALALGWTNIVDVGNALLGMPPWGIPQARGQAPVPNWAGSWKDCGPLLTEHMIGTSHTAEAVRAVLMTGVATIISADARRDAALREVIVLAVAAKLEAGK